MRALFFEFTILMTSFCVSQEVSSKVYRNLKKAIRNKDKVEILSLYGKKLKEFPEEIFELKNLKVLNLTNNEIEIIPDQIKSLNKLEKLILMKNQIKVLPPSLVEL